MKVIRNRAQGTLSLCQGEYIKNLLTRFGMLEAKVVAMPVALNVKLEKAAISETKYPYQQLIGGLLYFAVCTRPDIAYATSLLSQFNSSHNDTHWIAAKRILRYLVGTIDYGLMFKKNGEKVEAYADADWAGDIVDRKSYTGLIVKLGNCAISWESRKQKTIALSSTEVEYLSLSDATREIIFIKNLLKEVIGEMKAVTLYNDSQSAQKIVNNTQHHRRTKHRCETSLRQRCC